jgi:hypothetical protein
MISIRSVIVTVCALAPAAAFAQPQQLQGFNIVLVQGDQQPGNSSELPPAAQGAIGEMKNFLPFKSYRLVDSAWILTSSPSGVNSRLQGPDGQDFTVMIETEPTTGNSLRVLFRLQDVSRGDARSAQRQDIERDLAELGMVYGQLQQRYRTALREFETAASKKANTDRLSGDLEVARAQLIDVEQRLEELRARRARQAEVADPFVDVLRREVDSERVREQAIEAELKTMQGRYNPRHPEVLRQQFQLEQVRAHLQQLNARLQKATARVPIARQTLLETPAGPPLIDTTFTMRLGETVVVGTSRVRGDKALIAVLTAVPQSKR